MFTFTEKQKCNYILYTVASSVEGRGFICLREGGEGKRLTTNQKGPLSDLIRL